MERVNNTPVDDDSTTRGEDGMKVPIDDASTNVPTEAELDEEAMVEAAIRAGEQAAEEELAAEAEADFAKVNCPPTGVNAVYVNGKLAYSSNPEAKTFRAGHVLRIK